jgi:hypothetical protein
MRLWLVADMGLCSARLCCQAPPGPGNARDLSGFLYTDCETTISCAGSSQQSRTNPRLQVSRVIVLECAVVTVAAAGMLADATLVPLILEFRQISLTRSAQA